jgi:hypothetical protein
MRTNYREILTRAAEQAAEPPEDKALDYQQYQNKQRLDAWRLRYAQRFSKPAIPLS